MRSPIPPRIIHYLFTFIVVLLAGCGGGGGGGGGDITPPTVTSVTPVDSATAVVTTTAIRATFNEAINSATLNSTTFTLIPTLGGAAVSGTVSYDSASYTATFTPSSPLAGTTQYTATITTGVTDAAGNPLGSNYSWSFTTGAPDTTAPTISSVYPADTTLSVVTTTPVRVTFSEAMASATLTGTSFTLATTVGSTPVSGTVSYDSASYTATFTPSAALTNATQYTATITTAVTDLSGNPLAGSYSWSFTTEAASAQWQPLGGQVSASDAESEDPTMLVTGTTPSVGYRHASFDIDLNTWNGADWGTTKVHPQSGNINGSIYSTPGFASDGSSIFVTYSLAGVSGGTNDAFYDRIYLDQCTTSTGWTTWNSGNELSTPYSASFGGANAWEPAVAAVSGLNPIVGWVEADVVPDPDTEDGAWLASVNASSSTRSTILSRDNTSGSYTTAVRTVGVTMDSSGNAYLAQWESDAVDQNLTNLYVTRYTGGAFTNLGTVISADYDYNNLSVPSMVVIGTDLYIAYTEANASDYTQQVYVKKFNGVSWSIVGGGPVSAFSASEHYDSGSPSLANVNGTLYVAWDESDQTSGSYIFVARWDSATSQWVIDGNKLNVDPARAALDPSLAYSSGDNTLYVAFEEFVSGWPQIFVKRKLLP